MLSTMREKTKVIMLVVGVAFVVWLVVEVGMGGTQQGRPQDLGSVNGTPIRLQEWNEAYRVAYDNARQQNPGVTFTREEQRQIEDQAFETIVQGELLRAEYRRRGITVADREIADAVRRYPPPEVTNAPDFRTDGQFDPAKYERFLTSNNEQTHQFLIAMEQRYREELPRFKLLQQVTADIYVSDAKLWTIYRDQHDSASLRLLVIRPDQVIADASVRVTDEEVQAYYDAHPDEFNRPARAMLSFVVVPKLPTAFDSAQVMARARALRDSILRGTDFADVARTESADSASREQGGSLGTFARGQMVPAFDQAVWRLPLGQVSEPVATAFGAHLIKVERRTSDSATASHILLAWGRIGARLDTLESRADSLDRIAAEQSDPSVLDSAAARMNLAISHGPPLLQGVPYTLGRFRIPDVGVWAFEARIGETSPVVENNAAFYVFRLDSLTPAGVAPLTEVVARVRVAVTRQKKRAAAEQIAQDAERRVAAGESFDQVAAALRLTVTSAGPFTRTSTVPYLGTASAAVGAAFRLRTGERSGLMDGADGFYIMQAERRVHADSTAWLAQRDDQRSQLIQQARRLRVQNYLSGLRRAARIRDNRAEALRPAAQDADAAR